VLICAVGRGEEKGGRAHTIMGAMKIYVGDEEVMTIVEALGPPLRPPASDAARRLPLSGVGEQVEKGALSAGSTSRCHSLNLRHNPGVQEVTEAVVSPSASPFGQWLPHARHCGFAVFHMVEVTR
jgi:hypothetical protein